MKTLPLLTIIITTTALFGLFGVSRMASASATAGGAQWPLFHGDAARRGFVDSKIPSSPKNLWTITVQQLKPYGVDEFDVNWPVINNGQVYFSAGQQVFAADLNSGKIIWNYGGDRSDFFPGAAGVGEGKIFVRVADSNQLKKMSVGFIYALDEGTGQLHWKYQTKGPITHSTPLVEADKVFVGDDSGSIYALDAQTGQLVWQKQLDAYYIHSSPAYADGVVFVGTETRDKASFLYALDAQDGQVRWQFQTDWTSADQPNLVHGTPAISDNAVYFGSENGWFYALNKNSGELIWKKLLTKKTRTTAREAASPGLVGVSTAPALAYGKIFVGLWEGRFLAISQKDGEVIWEYPYGDEGTDSSAVAADGKVCLGANDDNFYCFDEASGKVIWKEELGGPSAALADGILVVPNALAAGNPGEKVVVAFSDQGSPASAAMATGRHFLTSVIWALLAVAVLFSAVVLGWALRSGKITRRQLLIYGGIPLVIIFAGVAAYRIYSRFRWTATQTKLIQEGKIDPATGSLITNDGSPKHIEYQGQKYFLGDGFCAQSNLKRFAVRVKRFNGAAGGAGEDGNTMYAIGDKDNPEYIESNNEGSARDCWKRGP